MSRTDSSTDRKCHQTSTDSLNNDRIAALEQAVAQLQETVGKQAATIDRQQAQLEEQAEQIDTYEERLSELESQQNVELRGIEDNAEATLENIWIADQPVGRLLDGTNSRTKALENQVETFEESTTTEDTNSQLEDGDNAEQSSLAQVLQWPSDVVRRELTKNGALARKFAQRLPDLAHKTQKGYVVTSRTISDFFVSDQGKRLHTQTVSRIIDFLVRFGGDHVSVSKKHGRKRLAFDEELMGALRHSRGDGRNTRGA